MTKNKPTVEDVLELSGIEIYVQEALI